MISKKPDRLFHFPDKFQAAGFCFSGKQSRINVTHWDPKPGKQRRTVSYKPVFIVTSTIDHILPDYDSKSVAVIIPSLRLDLEMLPHHVEAGLFHFLDVKDHRCIRWRRVQTLRPVSLVEHAILELYFAVKTDPQEFLMNFRFQRKLPHGEIADGSVVSQLYFKIIKIRSFTVPQRNGLNRDLDPFVTYSQYCCFQHILCRNL